MSVLKLVIRGKLKGLQDNMIVKGQSPTYRKSDDDDDIDKWED